MSAEPLPAEINVVGGGFVGLAFAIAAARHGYEVALSDRKAAPEMPLSLSANVIAINPVSEEFLHWLGVWEHLPSQFRSPYGAMEVTDATGVGTIAFSAEEAGAAHLGHIVDQRALLAILAEVAESTQRLSLSWETSLAIEIPSEADGSSLLVGADGTHSQIREAAGFRKIGFAYDQNATVCVARLSKPHGNTARQWFNDTGPVALLPLSEPDLTAVVWSSFEDLSQLEEEVFTDRLAQASEQPDIQIQGPRFSFPLMQQQALSYVTQGCALLGDAAHTIHPLAGQGANLGFADGRCLATELAAARLEGRGPGDLATLKRFEQQRKPHNHLAGLAMEGFHRLFTNRQPAASLLRNLGLRLVGDNAGLRQIAIQVASGRL